MARHKSRREIEQLVAVLRPQPPVPASVRRLPTVRHNAEAPMALQDAAASLHPAGAAEGEASGDPSQRVSPPAVSPSAARPAVLAPLAPQRYMVKFTASAETYDKLRRAQDLLRHQIPDGDPAAIFDRALTVLLQNLAKQKLAETDRPRGGPGTCPGSRHIPAEIKRAVWRRDGGQCAFVAANGRRCTERGFLEFHHVKPYATGGEPTAENIELRCRAHNGYEAELYFGPGNRMWVSEARGSYFTPLSDRARGRCCAPPLATRFKPRT